MKFSAKITVTALNTSGIVEFKIEDEETGEHTSSPISQKGSVTSEFLVGGTSQDIWFWWDSLNGSATLVLTLVADDPKNNVILFDGDCTSTETNEVRVTKSYTGTPRTFKTTGSPRLEDDSVKPITFIKW